MKKIGVLFGMENSFPPALIQRINDKKVKGVTAELVSIDRVIQGEQTEYAVIIDRISQDVPFYRAFLKNAAISGTAEINNPFWWSADEKFFNNALAFLNLRKCFMDISLNHITFSKISHYTCQCLVIRN